MGRNMSPAKVAMPAQDPQERSCNFREVTLGYTREMAMEEAARCLECKHRPCVEGCPVRIDIPGFIREIARGNTEEAFLILNRDSALPAVCGRVCPVRTNLCPGHQGGECRHRTPGTLRR